MKLLKIFKGDMPGIVEQLANSWGIEKRVKILEVQYNTVVLPKDRIVYSVMIIYKSEEEYE